VNSSRHWLEYFRRNQADPTEIPWDSVAPPPAKFRDALITSLQQFQLGENAAGRHFLELARRHAETTDDADFPEAIALFIAEEQRHSRLLAVYLHQIGAPLLKRHWTHDIFRRLRHLAGLEAKVRVLVTAEIMAIPYYRAVLAAVRCPTLQAICRRILKEEAQHLNFQGNTLHHLQSRRSPWQIQLHTAAQRMLLAGTCLLTWLEHRRVFQASGQDLGDVWRSAQAAMAHVQRSATPAAEA
jgi:predicted metal-dependent hydrolase